jgi:hypothetical protein
MSLRRISAKKFGIIGCVVLGSTFLGLVIWLDAYYRENRPAQPQPSEGRLYATSLSKDILVYLTKREQLVCELLMPSSFVFLMLGAFLQFRWKEFSNHKISKHRE